jgi:hypothetical protein
VANLSSARWIAKPANCTEAGQLFRVIFGLITISRNETSTSRRERSRCCLVAVIADMAFNVPLNKQLGAVDPVVLNHVQTVAPPIGAVLMLMGPRQH